MHEVMAVENSSGTWCCSMISLFLVLMLISVPVIYLPLLPSIILDL